MQNKYVSQIIKISLIAITIISLMLVFSWQTALAQEADDPASPVEATEPAETAPEEVADPAPTDEGTGSIDVEPAPAATQLWTFKESDSQLVVTYNADFEETTLKLNDDGKAIWEYVGPGEIEGDCNSLSWQKTFAGNEAEGIASQVKMAEAIIDTTALNDEEKAVKASLTLTLRDDATTLSTYCFRVPVEGEKDYSYTGHQLENAPEPTITNFKFTPGLPLIDSDVPANVMAAIPVDAAGVEINPATWQSAKVENASECSADNADIQFTEAGSTGNKVDLKEEDAGSILCFRVASATETTEGSYLYDTYTVPTTVVVTGAEEDEEDGINWIIATLAGVVLVGGIAFFAFNRFKSKK